MKQMDKINASKNFLQNYWVSNAILFNHFLALYILLWTGCRPNEAAYIVFHKSIFQNDYFLKTYKSQYKATMPSDFTKTKIDYFWLLPNEINDAVKPILNNTQMGFNSS